ncbi:uncharacterized protein LOC109721112 isoform X2 [Ananas comosus]|uniref:Uncharacterized protein LOC109721112 isoform X2 n=1 Tax=Ananas comosus TaxID=4615 RepID=A0A6P5GFI1_ANACO|nr:uncharacterized protein LOC109721112 isoform X2 [Ananas comosus]
MPHPEVVFGRDQPSRVDADHPCPPMGCWSSAGLMFGLLLAEHPILASSNIGDPLACEHSPPECLLMAVLTFAMISLAPSLGFSIVALENLETRSSCCLNFFLDRLLCSGQRARHSGPRNLSDDTLAGILSLEMSAGEYDSPSSACGTHWESRHIYMFSPLTIFSSNASSEGRGGAR